MKFKFIILCTAAQMLFSPDRTRAQVITTIAGNGATGYSGNGGPATAAKIFLPFDVGMIRDGADVKVDGSGNIIFSDQQNHVIRKIDAVTGNISTIVGNASGAGTGFGTYTGDGGQATAAGLSLPAGMAFNPVGDLYFCDFGNNVIRKVNHSTNVITTVAGTMGATSSTGDGGPATAATIGTPVGITFDASGNFYFTDNYNMMVRKVSVSTGVISAVAGGGGTTTDGGPATTAALDNPYGLLFDASGNLYLSEAGNFSNRVRIINSSGIISTYAGNGTLGPTTFGVVVTSTPVQAPRGLAKDANGNIYIVSHCDIMKVNATTNIVTKIAGNDVCSWTGDGGAATAAGLNAPNHIAFNSAGDLFVDDDGNMRIRKVNLSILVKVENVSGTDEHMTISPNPCKGSFKLGLPESAGDQVRVVITNALGQKIKEFEMTNNKQVTVDLNVPSGIYFVNTVSGSEMYSGKIIVE